MELKSKASIFPSPRPILKWAGGKQQLLAILLPKTPKNFNRYIELFFGGRALFFALQPDNAIISESNPELINLMAKYKSQVEVVSIGYRYSAGNHGQKISVNNNKAQEYLFVGF